MIKTICPYCGGRLETTGGRDGNPFNKDRKEKNVCNACGRAISWIIPLQISDVDLKECPKCKSENIIRMDGSGAVSKYGSNIMIDIAPDMWLCQDCKESFSMEDTYNNNREIL